VSVSPKNTLPTIPNTVCYGTVESGVLSESAPLDFLPSKGTSLLIIGGACPLHDLEEVRLGDVILT
jgi:hypothetical protein